MCSFAERIARGFTKCPFLHSMKEEAGEAAAERAAKVALQGVPSGVAPLDPCSAQAFELAHGLEGAYPFATDARSGEFAPHKQAAPLFQGIRAALVKPDADVDEDDLSGALGLESVQHAPFAAASLSGYWGDYFNRRNSKRPKKQRKPDPKPRSSSSSSSNPPTSARGPSPPGAMRGPTPAFNPTKYILSAVVTKSGRLQCPPPIVAMRAALARTPLVKSLRPEALPVKLAAVSTICALANIPPGMLKEHFAKFSAPWVATIHIGIPLVASLRKAVVLPPYAIAFTIGFSVVGQIVGGKMERARLAHAKTKAAAIASGAVQPDDSVLMNTLMSIMSNPWSTPEPVAAAPVVPAHRFRRSRQRSAAPPKAACRAPRGLGFGQSLGAPPPIAV